MKDILGINGSIIIIRQLSTDIVNNKVNKGEI